MNTLQIELKKYFRPITNFLLTACMILAVGVAGVQAQDDDDPPVPDPVPAYYFFQVGDEKTNEITLAPGENFILKVGFTLEGPCDGATATLRWNQDELVVPGTQVTNLIGSLLPFALWNVITQSNGHLSFTQAMLGGYILPEEDGAGGYVETDYLLMEFQVNVPEGATWASSDITHETNDPVMESLLTFYGNSLATHESMPTFTIFNSDAAVDCPGLGLNIGEACDDGDDNTENDMVNADCECVGEPIAAEYCTPEGTNDGRYIENFSTTSGSQNITNDGSGFSAGGYGDFTALTVEQGIGGSVNFTVDIMGGTAGFRIWVDWNQDGVFDTENEVAYQSSSYQNSQSGSFAVPADAMLGSTTMRIVSHWLSTSGDIDPCAVGFTYGEFEDYTFNVSDEIAWDCPTVEANIGDACDDGNAGTIGETIDADCNCTGGIDIAANDEACTATALACGDTLTQSLIGATASLDDDCFGTGTADVWFNFSSDGSQIVTVGEVSSFDAVVQLFVGDDCDNLVEVGACKDGPENYVVTEAGNYFFRVRPYSSTNNEANITVALTCVDYDCPLISANFGDACDDGDETTINDQIGEDCECAGVLPAEGSACFNAIAVDCNAEPATYSSAASNATNTTECTMGSNGLWFSFMGTGADITVNAIATFDIELSVNSGSCDDLTSLVCRDFYGSSTPESVTISPSVAGEMYYVYIAHYSSSSTTTGDITIDIDCAVVPDCTAPELALAVQDADGNAIEGCLEAGSDYYVMASLSGGEGNDNYNVSANGGDIVVVAADGSVVLGPFAAGTDADVDVVGVEDDLCGASGTADSPDVCAPSNDECADAISLACNQPVDGSTYNATNSGMGSPSCAGGTQDDVFYTLDVMEGMEYTVSVNGDDYDGVLVIYSGPCDDLTELACADNGFSAGVEESITWTAANTETVVIRTYDWSSSQGNFTISVTCAEEVDCPNLGLNIGEECENADGMIGIVDENCNCYVAPTYDCPDIEANIGDACELPGGMGVINANCECVPAPDCENYTYYLADHAAADGISDIYEVTLSGGVATMDYIATSDIEVHIAFNATDNLIYAVSKHENSYRTLNPLSGIWGPTVDLGADYGEITAAVFAPNGKLVFGSQNQNAIFSVNVNTVVVSSYDTYSPVTGGDLAYTSDGMLYMATRSGNGLYEVYPAPTPDVLLGNVPIKVTGLAATDGDQLLLSAQGLTSLELYNTDGSNAASYALELDGAPYTLRDGDMASGCNTGETVNDCDNYVTFYVNHGPDIDGSDLYTVDFSGGNANLTYVTNVDFEAHIGYNAEDELMYFVNKDGSIIRVYNVGTDSFEGDLPILGGVDQLTAVVYDSNSGQLYVGDANSDVIASVDLGTGVAAYYADAPVYGGDLAVLNGTMYLARRSVSELYEIVPFGSAVLVGSIPQGVNGMAPSPNPGNLVTSSAAQNAFVEISAADGSTIGSHPAMLDGNPFTFINGDMASGCIDGLEEPTPPSNPFMGDVQSELTAFPNPTSGPSTVVFVTAETSRTLVEVYDMSGRNVATLFNQEAQQGEEYRLDFDGAALPNGVYIYRLTTQNETIIEKFMIAK